MPQHLAIDDNYSGHVSPGAAPQRRTVAGAEIVKISVGSMDNNAYLVQCRESRRAVLIDAANESERLLAMLHELAPGLDLIITTHQHPDHWWALLDLVSATGAPTAAHPRDAGPLPVQPDRLVDDGDHLAIGELDLEVIHLAGHTPGSITLALTDGDGRTHLFTGDSLFPGGLGKTASSFNFDTLYRDVTTKLFDRFPDDTVVYPGHGDDTTLGAERPQLPEWRERGW